jgi:hypothetical protein
MTFSLHGRVSPVSRLLLRALLRPAPVGALAALILSSSPSARACACGCGIYELGTDSMLPAGSGVMAFVDYAYQDQDQNWSGDSRASADDNPDKDIRTSFATLALQDMVTRSWGLRLDLPYERRHFETTGGASGSDLVSLDYEGFGDIRIEALYTGFSPDDAYGDVDRDTEIGSGSTDLLLGAFYRMSLGASQGFREFTQVQLDLPVLTQSEYRPGAEADAAAGIYYTGLSIGRVKVSPMAQVKVSLRGRDSGANASDPVASGFERLILAPGLEFSLHPVTVYADVEFPTWQHFTGNQLASPVMLRLDVSWMF